MRRVSFIGVLCVSLGVAAVAVAAPVGGMRGALLPASRRLVQRAAPGTCAVASGAVSRTVGSGRVLLGARTVGSVVDRSPAGMAQAFSVRGLTAGTVASIKVYLASGSQARKVMVALYSASGCRSGSRLTSGSLARPKAGAWNAVAVRPMSIQAGRMYWLVVLGSRGVLRFREPGASRCTSASSRLRGLTALPVSWKVGVLSNGCGISAYAVGAAATIQHGTLGTGASAGAAAPVSTAGSTGAAGSAASGSGGAGSGLSGVSNPLGPTAAFAVSADPTIGQSVTFNGSGSTCDLGPCTYAWDNDGGNRRSRTSRLGAGTSFSTRSRGVHRSRRMCA